MLLFLKSCNAGQGEDNLDRCVFASLAFSARQSNLLKFSNKLQQIASPLHL